MKIVRGLTNARHSDRGCVLTIGNFDGMHLGHESIVRQLAARGREYGLPTALLTFEPNPREYFDPANAPAEARTLGAVSPSLGLAYRIDAPTGGATGTSRGYQRVWFP